MLRDEFMFFGKKDTAPKWDLVAIRTTDSSLTTLAQLASYLEPYRLQDSVIFFDVENNAETSPYSVEHGILLDIDSGIKTGFVVESARTLELASVTTSAYISQGATVKFYRMSADMEAMSSWTLAQVTTDKSYRTALDISNELLIPAITDYREDNCLAFLYPRIVKPTTSYLVKMCRMLFNNREYERLHRYPDIYREISSGVNAYLDSDAVVDIYMLDIDPNTIRKNYREVI